MKLTAARRKRLYEASLAAIGLAVVYGFVDGDQAAAWALLLVPVIGVARANVTPDE